MFIFGIVVLAMPALVFLDVSVSDEDIIYLNYVKYVRGFRLHKGVFRVIDISSYTSCVKECLFRVHCHGITYHRTQFYCHLVNQSTDLQVVSDNNIISSHPTDWNPPKDIAKNCSEKPCGSGQRCTELSSGNIVCINTECSDPPEMTLSTTSSLRSVGITISNEYLSNSSFPNVTCVTESITCKADNTWTSPKYTFKQCPLEFQIVSDAYCILLVTNQSLTATDSDEYCQTKGGRLIWMTSVEKFDAVEAVITSGRYFLAGTDVDVEGIWRLPNGEEMTWIRSRGTELNTDVDDCLTYDRSRGKLRDIYCDLTTNFICEVV
ncbi:uncharacterized protein LOC132547498 [Ylistrum balloti]|uniref:uncharacterized protein LOC132547498 n=1 Tax=Ylistrum balloti TaxID=509963 RepID=UPI002905CFAD|nr:uncharacterized protein LOC132547498 [Ylistrum balloti]